MVREGSHSINVSARRTVHEGSSDHCSRLGVKEGLAKGPGSGMRMLSFYINRAGKTLSASRRAKLEKAKTLLADRIKKARDAEKRKAA